MEIEARRDGSYCCGSAPRHAGCQTTINELVVSQVRATYHHVRC